MATDRTREECECAEEFPCAAGEEVVGGEKKRRTEEWRREGAEALGGPYVASMGYSATIGSLNGYSTIQKGGLLKRDNRFNNGVKLVVNGREFLARGRSHRGGDVVCPPPYYCPYSLHFKQMTHFLGVHISRKARQKHGKRSEGGLNRACSCDPATAE
jgi:hypothetical protein